MKIINLNYIKPTKLFDELCKETSTAVLVAWCKKAGIGLDRVPTGFTHKLEETDLSKSLKASLLPESYVFNYHDSHDIDVVDDNNIQDYIR